MNLYKLTFFFSVILFLCCEKDIKKGQSLEKYSSYEEAGFDSEKIYQLSKLLRKNQIQLDFMFFTRGKNFFNMATSMI